MDFGKSVLQYSQRGLGGFAIGLRTDRSMTGIELGVSTRPGDDGLELAGVVGVEVMSPPSPSLSMAESSANKNFLLLGSTTKKIVLESEGRKKRKKREEKEELTRIGAREENSQVPGTERKEPREPERSEGEL